MTFLKWSTQIQESLNLIAEWMPWFSDHIFAYYDSLLTISSDEITKILQMWLNIPQCRHKGGEKFPRFWWDNHQGKSSHIWDIGCSPISDKIYVRNLFFWAAYCGPLWLAERYGWRLSGGSAYAYILILPNWGSWVTRIEVLSSYNPIPGLQGGTVRHTSVTNMEKKGHQIGHYFS